MDALTGLQRRAGLYGTCHVAMCSGLPVIGRSIATARFREGAGVRGQFVHGKHEGDRWCVRWHRFRRQLCLLRLGQMQQRARMAAGHGIGVGV